MPIAYKYDVELSSYKPQHHTPLQGTPVGEVAQRIADYTGDSPSLDALKNTVLESLLREDSSGNLPELKMGAYRAVQLLAINGCDHLVRHMFSTNTETLPTTTLPNVVKASALIEDEGSYYILYQKAKELLSKSSYYNEYQSQLHGNMDVDHTGMPSLLKLLALILLYMDAN